MKDVEGAAVEVRRHSACLFHEEDAGGEVPRRETHAQVRIEATRRHVRHLQSRCSQGTNPAASPEQGPEDLAHLARAKALRPKHVRGEERLVQAALALHGEGKPFRRAPAPRNAVNISSWMGS